MAANTKLELTWIGKEKPINVEPRILIEDKTLSYSKESNTLFESEATFNNMLIHGDNLLALKALEAEYTGKIKCIYIDPPYNANAFGVPFDDNVEHSFYLTLMRARIQIMHKLLREDGIFCMQCDYNEMAYLKIVCDEIFGRLNYVTMITVKTSSESGVKVNANKPAKVSEYILMFAKNKDLVTYKTIRVVTGYDKNYETYIINPDDDYTEWQFCNIKDILSQQLNVNKKNLTESQLREFQIKNKNRVFSVRDISDSLKKYIADNNIDKNKVFVYTTSTGKKTLLYKNGEIVFVRNKVFNIGGKEELTKIASDIWLDIAWDGIAKEGNVKFKNSKKPERLIKRILEAFTNEGDLVLDSFLGSGTTSAVSQKMNRSWIGIEMGDQIYSLCVDRIKNVINGVDNTGITSEVNWLGGGGYRFYELAPTLIREDAFGQEIINPEYNGEMLASAVAIHEGYKYLPTDVYYWKQASNESNSYLYVTTSHINKQHIDSILAEMQDDEHLLIVCKSYDDNATSDTKKIAIKKIPQLLLKNCEFGVDNYNLNIICPPTYEEEEDD